MKRLLMDFKRFEFGKRPKTTISDDACNLFSAMLALDYVDAIMPKTIVKDELLCDIPLEEENEASYKHPKRWQRIDSFQNENEAYNKTNCTKSELREIVEHFGMEDIVRVPIPNSRACYSFNREELFIYTLIKMKTGFTHTDMEEYVTHSDARRMSYGYKFLVR
jgi:hypothetical protein